MEDMMDTAAELQHDPGEWYRQVDYEDSKIFIRTNLNSAARSFIAIGYYLKHIRDGELFREDGYESIWEFAQAEYGISKSTASRYMSMNDRFSQGGDSPLIDSQYKDFDKSKLQEMLSLTDEQLEQVTPGMRVEDIREMKPKKKTYEIPYFELEGQLEMAIEFPEVVPEPMEQARPAARTFLMNVADLVGDDMGPEEIDRSVAISQQQEPQLKEAQQPLSAYGTPKLVYPEDSLIAMNGCGGGHGCFSCHLECNIRQEECYCVEAPMGNPFPCTTMDVISKLRAEIGSRCQFIDLELAYHRAGDNEPVPCCKKCSEMCEYRCGRSVQPEPEQGELKPEVIDAEFSEVKELQDEGLTDLQIAQKELERANNLLNKCLKDVPDETNIIIRGMKIKVAALASLVCEMDDIENPPPKTEQPELPLLKNNDQRAAFVDAYETWPLWIETKETGERYYRYDLADGTSMVVKVYHAMLFDYRITGLNYEERFSEGYGRHEYYLLQPGKFFKDCEVNRSVLIEKLKEIHKKMENPKIGTKMYAAKEHLYYVKGCSSPLREYCVYEGIVKDIRKVGYTELCLKAKDVDGYEELFYYPIKEIGKSVFYTPEEAALLARDKTEQYEKTWERMLEEPLRRTWEYYFVN